MSKFVLPAILYFATIFACNQPGLHSTIGDSSTISKKDTATSLKPTLELVFMDSTFQLTGVAVDKSGRLFTNYPLWSPTYKNSVVEIMPGNRVKVFPNAEMNNWKQGGEGKNKWVCVQAVYIDDNNIMWVVDPAAPMIKKVYGESNKLVKIDLAKNTIEKVYSIGGITSDTSYINDVRVDTKKQFAYMTNSKDGGIVVVDLQSGKAREVLKKHPSTLSDPAFKFIMDGHELIKDGKPMKFNSDGIALTPDGDWLYYKPLTDDKLYRIKTEYLRNTALSEQQIGSKVEDLGHFVTTDGMIFDKKGNLYLGDLQKSSIVQISKDLKMKTVLQDDRLIWPDSYSISGDGYLYISCSQIQKQPNVNNGVNKRTSPYTIYKMKLPE